MSAEQPEKPPVTPLVKPGIIKIVRNTPDLEVGSKSIQESTRPEKYSKDQTDQKRDAQDRQ